jgi:hypothetical protein
MGPSGSGKTTAIKTLIDAGITPFCIFTEPGFEVLGDIPPEKLKWNYIPPSVQSWDDMKKMGNMINMMSVETLSKLGDINKRANNQLISLFELCNNYVDQRTGETFGDVCEWNTDRALVVDSMTGLSDMAMGLQVGNKPVRSQADWGIAQNTLEFVIKKLTMGTKCTFVLIGHVEREVDEVGGGSKIMIATLGKKLAPKIPLNFSDVVLAVRAQSGWSWSTATPMADLKTRNLKYAEGLPPSFGPILESWKRQGGLICPTPAL